MRRSLSRKPQPFGLAVTRHLSAVCSSCPHLRIRHLRDADRAVVAELQTQSWLATYETDASPSFLGKLPSLMRDRWRELRFNSREFALVAVDEDVHPSVVHGFITVFDGSESPLRGSTRPGLHAWVDNLHVVHTHKRRGAGRALMAAAAGQSLQRGFDRMRLSVLESNGRARAFYEALGGEEVSRPSMTFVGRQVTAIEFEWCSLAKLAAAGGLNLADVPANSVDKL